MIISTNYPEKLDPALIRPGRVDYKVHFGKCRPEDVRDLFDNFYLNGKTGSREDDDLTTALKEAEIPADVWTPAAVVQLMLTYPDDPEQALKEITKT